MKHACSICGLVALSTSLIACGGSSGGGGLTPSTNAGVVDPLTQASPPPAAPPLSPVPGVQAGAAFSFTGALQRSDFYNYPATNPLPAGTVTAQVAQNVNVSSVSNPFGNGTAFDYHSAESDAYPLQTLLFTTDSFYQLNQAIAPARLLLLGSQSLDDQKNSVTIQYDVPQIVDEIPEAANQSWTNNPAARFKTNYANGNLTDRDIEANAAYSERDVFVNIDGAVYPQVNLSAAMHADGSAKIVFVFNEEGRANFPFKSETSTYVMSKPSANGITLSASQLNVPVKGTPPPSPSPHQFAVAPAWFQTPLFTETNVDNGLTAIPSNCSVPPAFGTQARQIVKKTRTIDAAFGTVDETTTTRYDVSDFGVVCVQIDDNNDAFYDFALSDLTNQTPQNFFAFATSTAQPLIATTIGERLTLQSASPHAAAADQRKKTEFTPISPASIAIAEMTVRREAQRARVKHLQNELRIMHQALLRGGHVQ